jgi:hypothetical protein
MKNSDYIVHAGEEVKYGVNDADKTKFGNDLLDLKKLSADNNNETFFTIVEDVYFGFLVDPDMNCHINGINNALSHCVSSNDSAVGVVAGRRNDGSSSASDN